MQPTFYILRHGQTFETKTKTDYGKNIVSSDIITEGIPTIEKIGQYLKNIPSDFNVSSEFLRCQDTVKIIESISHKQFIFDKRLDEYAQESEFLKESFLEFKTRVEDLLNEIKNKNYENIVICTHGGIISALKHLIVDNSLTENDLSDYPEPEVLTIIKNKEVQELSF